MSLGGAGSLAVGAWLLIERGHQPARVAERSAVLFLITSAVNVITLTLVGLALYVGILPGPHNPLLSAVPAAVGITILAFFLVLPRLSELGAAHRAPGRIQRLLHGRPRASATPETYCSNPIGGSRAPSRSATCAPEISRASVATAASRRAQSPARPAPRRARNPACRDPQNAITIDPGRQSPGGQPHHGAVGVGVEGDRRSCRSPQLAGESDPADRRFQAARDLRPGELARHKTPALSGLGAGGAPRRAHTRRPGGGSEGASATAGTSNPGDGRPRRNCDSVCGVARARDELAKRRSRATAPPAARERRGSRDSGKRAAGERRAHQN